MDRRRPLPAHGVKGQPNTTQDNALEMLQGGSGKGTDHCTILFENRCSHHLQHEESNAVFKTRRAGGTVPVRVNGAQKPGLPGNSDRRNRGPCPHRLQVIEKRLCRQAHRGAEEGDLEMVEVQGRRFWKVLLAKRLRRLLRQSIQCCRGAGVYRESRKTPPKRNISGGVSPFPGEIRDGV